MRTLILFSFLFVLAPSAIAQTEALPFKQTIEVFRDEEGEKMVFSLRLKQPFLAEEFEESNYIRLKPLDEKAYLTYPKETEFLQKHAAFYGRLKGKGVAKLQLSYEMVTENLDGSPRVEVHQSVIEIPIPEEETGHENIYKEWARHQNDHFLNLLNYYPGETFLQYCLLQSRDRYGIEPPKIRRSRGALDLEKGLYGAFTGTLAIQEALQSQSYRTGSQDLDYDIQIHRLSPPRLRSHDYEALLEEKKEEGIEPDLLDVAALIPGNQYLLQFNSMEAVDSLIDLTTDYGDSLVRLFTRHAKHNRLHEKLEDQLCLQRKSISRLFSEGAIDEIAITGSNVFFVEGTDVTILLRLKKPEAFEKEASRWLAEVKKKRPDLVERRFNYQGHRLAARYTDDRMVSSFVVQYKNYAVFSNSHVAIRKMVDTINGTVARLSDADDYRYISSLLPPSRERQSGYFYASEEFIKEQSTAAMKISEKRRMLCFNNLVMLNNASLMYRLEYGRSPATMTDLIKERFVDPYKLICPHGGAYSLDAHHDTATCSLHNRIKYLTSNMELEVLEVSKKEKEEYDRYKRRYGEFWQKMFNPVAVRIHAAESRTLLEFCVLPFRNGDFYQTLREWLDDDPQRIDTSDFSKTTVASVGLVPGKEGIARFLREIPAVAKVLTADPTLADLNWIGDAATLNLCDGNTILEIDPTFLKPLDMMGRIPVPQQCAAGIFFLAATLPTYTTLDVVDRDKAERFLEQLSSNILLEKDTMMGLETAFDSYQLPDYKDHDIYSVSYRVYSVKVRFHIALVGDRLVAATNLQTLKDVIDASGSGGSGGDGEEVQMLVRFNAKALERLEENLRLYWEEKSRLACHGNIMSIYNLIKLYNVTMDEVPGLSQAKYGVTYYCPDGGRYRYDPERDRVCCTLHGNRQESMQNRGSREDSSFVRFFDSLEEIRATLCFDEDHLDVKVAIERKAKDG